MAGLLDRLQKVLSALTPEPTPARALIDRLREASGPGLPLTDPLQAEPLVSADEALQRDVLLEAVDRLGGISFWWYLPRLVNGLLQRRLPFDAEQAERLLRMAVRSGALRALSLAHLVAVVERIEAPRPQALLKALAELDAAAKKQLRTRDHQKLARRIGELLQRSTELEPGGPFSRALLAAASEPWRELLELGFAVSGPRPSAKWQAQARAAVEKLGVDAFTAQAKAWLQLGPVPGGAKDDPAPDTDVPFMRALLFAIGAARVAALAAPVGDFALECYRKISNHGPVCQAAGNACLWTLGEVGLDGVGQLGLLKMRVKYAVALRLIEKALADAAARAGLSPDDLEEIGVPTFELDAPVAEGGARISIAEGGEVKLTVPSALKGTAEHKALKRRVKDIDAMLAAQRLRLERLYVTGRSWPFATWRSRLLEHPLLTGMVQRLVWQADGRAFIGADAAALAPAGEVTLWHPIDGAPWSAAPQAAPFKQVDRETFTLPEGEERTSQFTGRRVKQHQFAALCRDRGWQYRLQGEFDSINNAVLALPRWGLRVELEVAPPHATGTSGMGIYLEVETGDVVFERAGPVPARVISEVLRDVALFAGD